MLAREELRRNQISVRLSDAEMDLLLDAAGDIRPGTYARDVLLRHLKRRTSRTEEKT